MITKLTKAQEKRLSEVYQEWLAIGRNCEPINISEATSVINEMYRRIGKPQPLIFKFSSPAMCVLAWAALKHLSDNQLGGQLGGQLRGQLRDQLVGQLWGQLVGQLGGQLGGQLVGQLGGQLRGQLRDQLSNYFAGQHWCNWQAFYDFCRQIGASYAKENIELLDLWVREGKSLHWWFPYDGIVLLSERHTKLHVDDSGRLHSEIEQACGYGDGWGIHAWHGVIVPQDVIEHPETITIKQIRTHGNIEVRRVMIERYGMARYLLDSGAKKVV